MKTNNNMTTKKLTKLTLDGNVELSASDFNGERFYASVLYTQPVSGVQAFNDLKRLTKTQLDLRTFRSESAEVVAGE